MRSMALLAGVMTLAGTLALGTPLRAEAPKIGAAAPAFELKGSDDQVHKLSDYKGKIVVLYFHSTECPWAKAYQPILNQLAQKFGPVEKDGKPVERVAFVGINSNQSEDTARIKANAQQYKTAHPILKDPDNKVADAYDARFTPHVFVIDGEGKLRYMGGLEKPPVSPREVGKSKEQYLEPAIAALLEGKEPPQTSTQAIGCSIKRVAR